MKVGLTGIPFAGGQTHAGVIVGPSFLRRKGLLHSLRRVDGIELVDHGDLTGLSGYKTSLERAIDENRSIARRLARLESESDLAIHLGGDHGVGLGTVAATLARYPDAAVIWVDAHGDINSPDSSTTGNFHGMPLALALGEVSRRHQAMLDWLPRWLDPSRLAIVGARSLDLAEVETIRRLGISVFDALEIRRRGIRSVMDRCLDGLSRKTDRPLHLSFDIDALDPGVAPSTGTPVFRGLSRQEGLEIVHRVAATRRLVAMDLVEFNPMIAPACSEATAQVTIELAATAVQSCVGGTSPEWRTGITGGFRRGEEKWIRVPRTSCSP